MSFSRAPLKRFNDTIGCAPPPGTYDIKPEDLRGSVSFDKSDRFKHVKAAALPPPPPPSPSRNAFVSPVRRTVSVDGLVEGSSVKKEKDATSMSRKQQKLLEKEIRSLVQERGEQDRRLLALEEELKKVENKLLSAVREKTGLAASVTTLERQRAELKKVNEFLKNKVSADTTKKRINSLTMELMEARNTLDAKKKELSVMQVNTDGQLKVLETDLQAARSTVTAMKNKNKDLEDFHQVSKSQNEALENENARLYAVIQELKEETRVVQHYLDTANDQIQDLCLKLQEKTKENAVAGSQAEKVKQLEAELAQCTADLESTRNVLRQKDEETQTLQQELQVSKDALVKVERRLEDQEQELTSSQNSTSCLEEKINLANQEIKDYQVTVRQQDAELARLREVLRRTEKELDERVAHLEQRYLFSEEERSKTQEEGLRRVEELKTELVSLKETKRDERKRQIQLEQEVSALTEELTKEKALVDSLSVLVEQERQDSEERFGQLKEEMEEVLGELALLENQEQKSQEAIRKLRGENNELEGQLNDTRALLQSKSCDVAALKEDHFTALTELQEAQMHSVSKMADIVTELESTKEALKLAEEGQKSLGLEVEKVTQKTKEERDKILQQKEEELKRLKEVLEEHQKAQLTEAREENSRLLLEVQTRLTQKEKEIEGMEVSHAALISQLHREVQLQTKEKEDALKQLEEQRGQSVTLLQNEKEEAQELLRQVSQEKVEIMEQLKQEQEEKVKIQTALQEEREALEVERKDHQQARSKVHTLQIDLDRADKECMTLLSEVKLKEESIVALENQLNTAEQDRNQLRSRLDEAEKRSLNFQTQLGLIKENTKAMQHELEEKRQDRGALQEQVEILTQEKVTLQWDMEEQRQKLEREIKEAQEKIAPSAEIEHWRKQYEELFAKVKPFQEQLNAFAAERNALLNENGANQEELNRLSDAYARLLGHQNQKQKIKHVMKLKDENISLKQEISKLRSQVNRQKSDLEQLKSKLPGASCRRFDPSKAFQHNKENRQKEKTEPFKDGNHYV
ncbi:hyaluronan mediated motility receptor [Antennarius striatus]|uniref:hyaluronan mediated motility receptor n=1 Tax=Antennarius striatus TaxID=241820 RepID=UPI0035B3E0CB